jgi:hypothetical protein
MFIKSLLTSLYQIPKAFGTLWKRGVRGDFLINVYSVIKLLLILSFLIK